MFQQKGARIWREWWLSKIHKSQGAKELLPSVSINKFLFIKPMCSMGLEYLQYLHEWLKCMENGCKYSIHSWSICERSCKTAF